MLEYWKNGGKRINTENWNNGTTERPEYWKTGRMDSWLDSFFDLWNKQGVERKNINRGFKRLRVWQDAVSLYVLACEIFSSFPFELKKVAVRL